MKKSVWALLALTGMIIGTMGVLLIACGETDPALAPAGAKVRIIGQNEEWELTCHDLTGLPAFCFNAWLDYMKAECVLRGGTPEDCENDWANLIDESNLLDVARLRISTTPGACGYNNSIVTAFVEKFTFGSAIAATETSAAEGEQGGALGGEPMNDIEIRFIAYDGEMYKLSDDPKLLPPLANPYVTRTDDRGKAELKYRVPRPTTCDFEYTYRLEADIGVSKASMTIDFSVEEFDEADESAEEIIDDDDDSA